MLSNKPYLVRAFYEWIVDSACTPFLVVNANYPRCNVPKEHVENGEITLNVSPTAIRDFKVSNELVEFKASFSGIVHIISAPIKAVLAIYAQENQQGMFFDYEDTEDEMDDDLNDLPPLIKQNDNVVHGSKDKNRSHLKLVE
jgi:stringent starvation protein B